jgi:hypothetical protein
MLFGSGGEGKRHLVDRIPKNIDKQDWKTREK